jgi:hypothetical protein
VKKFVIVLKKNEHVFLIFYCKGKTEGVHRKTGNSKEK